MNDLELIKQLEKEIGRELKKVSPGKVRRPANSYALDAHNHVVEMVIYGKEMDSVPVTTAKLKHLETLFIVDCSVRDISSLKELTNLTELDLRYNKITHLPPEFAHMDLEIKWGRDFSKGEIGIFLEDNPLESPPLRWSKRMKGSK